jgi:hypothetical protein
MIEQLHDAGFKSDYAYIAGFASIALSFVAWGTSMRAESAGTDRADRWGIFVGHWAPTFFGLGNALRSYEKLAPPGLARSRAVRASAGPDPGQEAGPGSGKSRRSA